MNRKRFCSTMFDGKNNLHLTSNDALLHILRQMYAVGSPSFLPDLAERIRGTSRRHLARRLEDVYPVKRDWDQNVVELVPGWFIGLNCNDDQKDGWLRKACDLLGKGYGPGAAVWVRWPKEIQARRKSAAERSVVPPRAAGPIA